MTPLVLHDFHLHHRSALGEVSGQEMVLRSRHPDRELAALREGVAWADLSHRSRLCLLGADRVRFLNGQVTQNIRELATGQGCYACLLNAKGKMQSDLKVHALPDELLLDFEPGLSETVAARLDKYVIADDVQVVDVRPHYGMLGVWGPRAGQVLREAGWAGDLPQTPWTFHAPVHPEWGQVYVMNQPRGTVGGWECFVPNTALPDAVQRLHEAVLRAGGAQAGWETLEAHRIESGQPRFGVDMDESNLPPEAGLEISAINYSKGCYIGQEIIARLRTYGQVAKSLRGLRLEVPAASLPGRGTRLLREGREVGYLTSVLDSPTLRVPIALGYVRREHNQVGAVLSFLDASGQMRQAQVVDLPFVR